jgi:hypothetical protein
MTRRKFLGGLAAAAATDLLPPGEKPLVRYVDHRFRPPPPGVLGVSRPYLSPEALADVRAWMVDELDEETRREIFQCGWADRRAA